MPFDPETIAMAQETGKPKNESNRKSIQGVTQECLDMLDDLCKRKPDRKYEKRGETASRVLKYFYEKVWPIIHSDEDTTQK